MNQKNYLIVETDKDGVLYAGEGTFPEWKERLGVTSDELKSDRVYNLREIVTGTESKTDKGWLMMKMHQVNPIGYGRGIFDHQIRAYGDWASIPLDDRIIELMGTVLHEFKLGDQK